MSNVQDGYSRVARYEQYLDVTLVLLVKRQVLVIEVDATVVCS